ncbi:universal stress protein [Liquorilactobacillus vini]|uniref:Universal stress protein n=1 Tax=Liquorilactobacillus vini DSM 20605 TaxID=1133569 RepID=A0A0R2CBH0_9LACO|nr:universal stress protein [Liquorilactobacillus vini]KRM88709.1 universal stress protein [Liquorilactobacillus vini DSM 20605]
MINYQRILVPIDGSKGAKIALNKAIKIAKENQAHLDILKVMDMNSLDLGNTGLILDGEQVYQIEQANESYLTKLNQELVKKYDLSSKQFHVHLRFGNPKVVIVQDFQPEYHNDLIVVGSTGKNFLERLVMGSVASFVVREASCDVLLARSEK